MKKLLNVISNGLTIIKTDMDEEKDLLEKDGDSVSPAKLHNFYNELKTIDNELNVDPLVLQLFYDDGLEGEEKMRRKIGEDIKFSTLMKEIKDLLFTFIRHKKIAEKILSDNK